LEFLGGFMRFVWLGVLCLSVAPSALWAQGFSGIGVVVGAGKKTVVVKRLLPATVNLNHKRIRVDARVEGTIKQGADLPSLLKTKLTVMIQKDPRFIIDEAKPETLLKFAVTNYYLEQYTIAGVNNQPPTHAWRGKIEVAYQAVEAGTNAPLDSENLTHTAGFDNGNNTTSGRAQSSGSSTASKLTGGIFAPKNKAQAAAEASENETRDQLIDEIVHLMGKRVAPTEESFEAPLPIHKLEPLSALAISHRWGTLEEQAEKMDPFPKADDDSYRTYLIGLAKEAQAYDLAREANERDLGKRPDISAQDAVAEFQRAQKYMDEARKDYKDILEANSKEKNFRDGDARTEEAVTIYATIQRHQDEYNRAMASAAPAPSAPAPGSPAANVPAINASRSVQPPAPAVAAAAAAAPAKRAGPLDQVLEFCKQGIDAASILEYINSPEFLEDAKVANYKFNFATDTVALKGACKENAAPLQTAMRSRLSAPAKPAAAAKPAAPATAPAAAKPPASPVAAAPAAPAKKQ
jgi:hypothetical protein